MPGTFESLNTFQIKISNSKLDRSHEELAAKIMHEMSSQFLKLEVKAAHALLLWLWLVCIDGHYNCIYQSISNCFSKKFSTCDSAWKLWNSHTSIRRQIAWNSLRASNNFQGYRLDAFSLYTSHMGLILGKLNSFSWVDPPLFCSLLKVRTNTDNSRI